MQIVPTLNFGGNCREAIQMYEKAFNGKISCMVRQYINWKQRHTVLAELFLLISLEFVGELWPSKQSDEFLFVGRKA